MCFVCFVVACVVCVLSGVVVKVPLLFLCFSGLVGFPGFRVQGAFRFSGCLSFFLLFLAVPGH